VKPRLEAEAEADPDRELHQEATRRWLMAGEQGATVSRAVTAARRAVSLARTETERYDAALWLACIDCDAGHHREELRLAQRLVEWRPKSRASWGALRRAANCNGRWVLAERADAALRAVEGASPTQRRGSGSEF